MADIRELVQGDHEEVMRTTFGGMQKNVWTAMPVQVTQDSQDGHVATVQPTIQQSFMDPATGLLSYIDHPEHVDVPITHMGGGGVSVTHPTKMGDTGKVIYASRPLDSWFQSDGSQQPIDNRMHSLGDPMYISGVRSIPRKLQQVSQDASHTRSDDKLHVAELHPQTGSKTKSCDPSTLPASDTFDPFQGASKYFEHLVHPTDGLAGNATDGGTTHSYKATHDEGASLNANNEEHRVQSHPTEGAKMSSSNGQHIVQAHPTAGVMISSSTSVGISAPSLSLPLGAIAAAALAAGAASSNVGSLSGDMSGSLPNPTVTGILNVSRADQLPNFANDTAAAAGGVLVGHLYRNGSILMARIT